MLDTNVASPRNTMTLRQFRKEIRKLLLRYRDNPELVNERRSQLGIPVGLEEIEMKKLETILSTIKTDNVVQEKDLAVISAIDNQIEQRIRGLLTDNGVQINSDGRFSSKFEAAKVYSAYKKKLKSADLAAPKSLMLAVDLLTLSYVLSGAISATSSVERLTKNWHAALWAVLSATAGGLSGFSSKVFASKLLDKVMEDPQPNILFAALAVPTALTPSIAILNASDIIPNNSVTGYLSAATFVTLLPIFTEDFVTTKQWMFDSIEYLSSKGLWTIIRDSSKYMEQTKLQLAAGLFGRCCMFGLAGLQSYGYVGVPIKYFEIENMTPILMLMAARVPFMMTTANNAIKIIEQLCTEGFSRHNLPDGFLQNFIGVFLNSAVTASIFLANSDLSKDATMAIITFIASVIAGTAARLKTVLELEHKLSPEVSNLLQNFIQPAVVGNYTEFDVEATNIRQRGAELNVGPTSDQELRPILNPSPLPSPFPSPAQEVDRTGNLKKSPTPVNGFNLQQKHLASHPQLLTDQEIEDARSSPTSSNGAIDTTPLLKGATGDISGVREDLIGCSLAISVNIVETTERDTWEEDEVSITDTPKTSPKKKLTHDNKLGPTSNERQ